MHVELVYRNVKHFETYEELELNVEPKTILFAARAIDEGPGLRLKSLISEFHPSQEPLASQSSKTKEIDFRLRQALGAWMEVDEIERDLEDGIAKETAALVALVTSVERSLQFLHKLLLMYPPVN